MGTAKILTLSLAKSYHFIGEDFSQHQALNALLEEEAVQHFVLYPIEDSMPLVRYHMQSNPERKYRVILIDGTWKKAYKMWQLATNLHDLPCVKLPEGLQGNYRIRKAPSDNALSTVEAGYHVFSCWQPDRDFSSLIYAFEQMIEFQISQMPPGVFERNYLSPR
jgi:DTW domain-containing protein YfiP